LYVCGIIKIIALTFSMDIPQNIISRTHYLEKIKPFIGKNLIKVITGQRRVGKSYLLYQVINELSQLPNTHIIYINKEDMAFSDIKNEKDLTGYVNQHYKPSKINYVFIDEIQDIANFSLALRSLLLKSNIDLYCTGSNAQLLSSDIAGFLSGRYIEITVYSLSYDEFLQFHQLKNSETNLDKYLKYGGLPYLRNLALTDEVVNEYQENIYNSIVYRDIVNRYSIRNTVFLDQLVRFLSGNIGSLFSSKKISDFLKNQKINIPSNQVQKYIRYLINAFLVFKVSRYDLIGKRIFEIGEKYYFENLGIRNSISGYKPIDIARIMENAVYNHLLYKGYTVYVGTISQLEIDFVAEKDGEKSYYQVTLTMNSEETLQREFGNLTKLKDNYPKFVITRDTWKGNTFEGIKTISLRDFLSS
jgi:uncharacterized protein